MKLLLAAVVLLAGCQTPPPMPAIAEPSEGASVAFFTLVSTLTTEVRTVVLQVAKGDPRSFEVSASGAIKASAPPPAAASAASAAVAVTK